MQVDKILYVLPLIEVEYSINGPTFSNGHTDSAFNNYPCRIS